MTIRKNTKSYVIQNEMEKINEDNRALRLRVESMEALLRYIQNTVFFPPEKYFQINQWKIGFFTE